MLPTTRQCAELCGEQLIRRNPSGDSANFYFASRSSQRLPHASQSWQLIPINQLAWHPNKTLSHGGGGPTPSPPPALGHPRSARIAATSHPQPRVRHSILQAPRLIRSSHTAIPRPPTLCPSCRVPHARSAPTLTASLSHLSSPPNIDAVHSSAHSRTLLNKLRLCDTPAPPQRAIAVR